MTVPAIEAPSVLIPGLLHPRVTERLRSAFSLVHLASSDPALLTEEMKARVRGIASAGQVDAAFIDALPNLEIIANFGVGYDGVDARHAGLRGIMVTNTPDVLTEEVADAAVGLLINTVRELPRAEAWLRDGRWVSEGGYRLTPGTLRGRRIGIFGMGRIGRAIARRLEAFGLPIAYHNRRPVEGLAYAYHPTLKELALSVDTLVSVAPATPQTAKIVDAGIFEALGANGVFVNVGRGATVDEAALVDALSKGTILAAGLDVFADEPNVPQALIDLPNATLLPHVASATVHTRKAMADLAADNIFSWFSHARRALTPVPETGHVTARI
ncbi:MULTISPECIES: 2-hydroxyacid dehydrogenase [Aminobacter]|jgi:lactate dehydrogenase-like 2-hydroxyacid dehydrogenase|uniref:Dehydrogenase n=2 Tax=Aminobacter TaxID=31988 RepID=A0AAC8YMT1_AMIAI|nr:MULTISPECIES: 2-hydroxyacid dehydrogenase [Aminobacter]AMS40849.1 dehydrogenase [Aminobacter aminovorans]MBA8908680.1 lactate dehydrogenase-like 2-hydroxyacid dehydrogenase [Aminobacter ciceronei]MBA9022384.1 lactate dehydrogenase-like 2-hydroxyacid dehydrogenase [Aminobacter ciceronei]MBB3708962.1 lactate dehydrogenase-like 2-hydroxyacid dehydrogenase [Aminobacter aminovorans]MRX35636.1 2-hydroxyacid dehydrogenase [Aminobacter sp. MDW-2]